MKRLGYRAGVECIAHNDEETSLDAEFMSGMATVVLLAYLFGKEQLDVAKDVVALRKKELELEAKS